MKTSDTPRSRPKVSREDIQKVIADRTRWKLLDGLQQHGPTTTTFLCKFVGRKIGLVSKHLIVMRDAGVIAQRMDRLYYIPEAFLVPGKRQVDFGHVLLRFDADTVDS